MTATRPGELDWGMKNRFANLLDQAVRKVVHENAAPEDAHAFLPRLGADTMKV